MTQPTPWSRFYMPHQYAPDVTGAPLPGAFLYFYVSGTSTPLDTFQDAALSVPNTNPVVANAAGIFPDIFLQALSYKVILTDSTGKQIWVSDPVIPAPVQPPITATQIPASNITVTTFSVIGYAVAGDLGTGAIYTSVGATSSGPAPFKSQNGTWFNLVLNGPINIGWFGAKGDGTTDNVTAMQSALDFAYSLRLPVSVPPGNFLTSTLTFKGQSIIGSGETLTTITGQPGQDVFLAPDYSTSQPGSLFGLLLFFLIKDLTIQVDSSLSASFTRPIYPITEAWTTGHTYAQGTYVTGAASGVYACAVGGTAGATQPSHTSGRATDGGAIWTYVDSGQLNVQNAGFAFPNSNGANSGDSIYPLFERVIIQSTYGGPASTAAIYSQRPIYEGRFIAGRCRYTTFGICCVPPTSSWLSTVFASDTTSVESWSIFCKYPLIYFNGDDCRFSNLSVYSENLDERGVYLLEAATLSRTTTAGCVFSNYYCEPNSASVGQISLFMGNQHQFMAPTFLGSDGTANILGFDASYCTADSGEAFQGLQTNIVVSGNFNTFRNCQTKDLTAITDTGLGNRFEVTAPTSIPFHSERPALTSSRTRAPAFGQDPAFVLQGLGTTPFDNEADLLFGGRELNWSTPTTAFADNTLETGGYVRIFDTDSGATQANGYGIYFGRRVPQCPCRVYFKCRVNSARSQGVSLSPIGAGGSIGGFPIPTFSMTTSWAVYSTDVDFSAMVSTQQLEPGIQTVPGGGYIDFAWMAIRPVNADFLLTAPAGGGGVSAQLSMLATGLSIVYPAGFGGGGRQGGMLTYSPVTFANLPASPALGCIAIVSDSNTATWGATIAGGGANQVLAWFNLGEWTVLGK